MSVSQGADELRTSWYPDQPGLNPSTVAGSSFGRLFSTAVNGQVDAQPLVWQGTVLVATETNYVYGVHAATGAVLWSKQLGSPFLASDIGCGDVVPSIGITSTPVIDRATGIAYLLAKAYVNGGSGPVAYYAHALSVATGAEQPGFPVAITGSASNAPNQVFDSRKQLQRPGLLLLDGVVYAAFGAHCDIWTYQGWVIGISTAGQIKTLFTTMATPNTQSGAGIWQSGGGLVSDGPGQILFSTGNAGTVSGPIAGSSPPSTLGEAIARVSVQTNGTLRATDFFSPYDAIALDVWDGDFGSGGIVGLPNQYFGTTQYPHLLVAQGKQGYLYLLDRDHLGGIGNGLNGGDAVLSRTGPYGGMWSKPAIWPGNGGYLYLPTASGAGGNSAAGAFGNLQVFKYAVDGTGKPTLAYAGASDDAFGFTSSSPVVTSDGTSPGSALVWVIWAPDGSGNGAQLRAYDAVPVAGAPVKRFSAAVGTSAKFTPPGVGSNRIYVGTRDGHLIAYGSPVTPPLAGQAIDFGYVLVNDTRQAPLPATANAPVVVSQVTSTGANFTASAGLVLPATLSAGQVLPINVTFAPSAPGPRAGSVQVVTDQGTISFALSGQGQSPDPNLSVFPAVLSFGGVAVGQQAAQSLTIANTGAAPLTLDTITLPGPPFSVTGSPAAGTTLGSGDALSLTVLFNPSEVGMYTSSLDLGTSVGSKSIQLSGVSTTAGQLAISPLSIDYGQIALGTTISASFTVTNHGGSPVHVTKSKPPVSGPFSALTTLAEGTTIEPSTTLTQYVSFAPTSLGARSDSWVLNADDGAGERAVTFTGAGAQDITAQGTIISLIPGSSAPAHNLEVIRDGVFPPLGTTDENLQYDSYTGLPRNDDWVGYSFSGLNHFVEVLFQEGMQFPDGGWFTNLKVQVRQNGSWVDVPGVSVNPVYPGANGIGFETFALTFPPFAGDAIRLDGAPGGSATFSSIGELRVFSGTTTSNRAPIANAGPNQSVLSSNVVTLDGGGSVDADGNALTYVWTQTSGPAITLSSSTAKQPTFVAPDVTGPTQLGFSLVVGDGLLSSPQSSVTITISRNLQDVTAAGTVVALVPNPTGQGNHNSAIIRDGVMPPAGSTNPALQFDTYNGTPHATDWIGYTFGSVRSFGQVRFQDGMHFSDGGWFSSLKIQVRQSGVWVDVPNVTAAPAYPGVNTPAGFQSYVFDFAPFSGDGVRIFGTPGGAAGFVSIAELRVLAAPGTGNQAPTANAGAPQSVLSGTITMLDGSLSNDPELNALSYGWTQTSGPVVSLSSNSAQKPTFVAPTVSTTTTLGFNLVVSDGSATSAVASTTVTVTVPPATEDITTAGTAIAFITSPTGGGNHNLAVIRDGVTPAPGSNNPALQYDTYAGGGARASDWFGYTFTSSRNFNQVVFQDGMRFGDGGWFTSLKVQVRQAGIWVDVPSVSTSPAYPNVNTGISFQTYTFAFPVFAGDGIRIFGAPGGAARFVSIAELRVFSGPSGVNQAPVANAGGAQSVASGASVSLNGSASSDPNGDTLSYAWSQTAGPAVTFSSSSAQKPSFTAPTVAASTTLGFSLVVSDGSLTSGAATTTVTVAAAPVNLAPVASAGSGQSVLRLATVTLDGSGSSDPNGDALTYTWTQATGPAVSLSSSTAQKPTFVAPNVTQATTLGFNLVVKDGSLSSSPASVSILVSPPANQAPTASAGSSQSVLVGATVTLDGSASSDPNGDPLSYSWSQTSGPAAGLSGASAQRPSFVAPSVSSPTTLSFSLVVSDGVSSSPAASVSIVVSPIPVNQAPTANAGVNQSVLSGGLVTLRGAGSTDPEGDALGYAWTQTSGPLVALSSTSAVSPTFSAPSVNVATEIVFALVVSDPTHSSAAATTVVTVTPPPTLQDITASGTPVAFVPSPTGGGNRNLAIIRDGVMPAPGTNNAALQFDTYNGVPRVEDWIGYTFTSNKAFTQLVFQDGMHFVDGGFFANIKVQVRQNGVWVDVPGTNVSPAYQGNTAPSFTTYTFTFPAFVGDGIRVDGAPGGGAAFVSVAELRAYASPTLPSNRAPVANAGPTQAANSGALVTLNAGASVDADADALGYTWTQISGPAVTLSSATSKTPTFTAPSVSSATTFGFSVTVSDGQASSSASVSINVAAAPTSIDVTASGAIVATVTSPTGGGNRNIAIIRDGVTPASGSANTQQQYDTYNGGGARPEEYFGYTFTTSRAFNKVVFQDGMKFADGGWFTSLKVQVRQGGTWVNVATPTTTPAYPGVNTQVSYQTYVFTFPNVTGDGIRIDGAPGGSGRFTSIAELRVFAAP